MKLTLLALALASLAAPHARAQDDGEPVRKCVPCKSLGSLPCPEHKPHVCELESNALYCSFVAGCEVCGGTGRVDCGDCEHPAAQKALEERRARQKRAEPGMLKLDETMGRALRKAESEHFRLVWEIDSFKVGRKRLDDHELLHLYLDRLEALHAKYLETLQVTPRVFTGKSLILVWAWPSDQKEGSLKFAGGAAGEGTKLMGTTSVFSMLGNTSRFPSDEDFHRYVVHNAAHLLFSNETPSYWIGQLKGGAWLDEGLASWFEIELLERAQTFCYQEQNTKFGFKGGKWRPAVRKLVAMDKEPRAAQIFQRVTNTLTPEEQAVSFSYVDYLIALDPQKFDRLGRELRNKVAARDALVKVFGVSPLEFEVKWKEWVLATYPAR
jgi:hypothetical protein